MTAFDRDRLEIDRLGNLISGFGWKIVKQEFTDEKMMVEIEKPLDPGVVDMDRLEIERLGNLITGFGWKIVKQEFLDEKMVVQAEKTRAPGVEVPESGPQ